MGKEWASEERSERLNVLLSSLQTGTLVNADTASKAEPVASKLPAIEEDAHKIGEAKKGAHLLSVLIQRDIKQENLNVAKVLAAIQHTQQNDLVLREIRANPPVRARPS